jgi:hypothetical protein
MGEARSSPFFIQKIEMNKSIKQYTIGELRALKQRLDSHFALKGDMVTDKEKQLMQVVNDELLSRPDFTYGPEVNYGASQPRFKQVGRAPIVVMQDESINVNPTHRGDYRTLEDCYEPGETEIWYFRKGMARVVLDALEDHNKEHLPQPSDLSKTHIKVGTVDSDNQREVFAAMQGDQWSPNGEAKKFISHLGLGHISMMAGDVMVFPHRTVMVGARGFYDLGQRTEVEENMDFAAIIDGKRELSEGPAPMAFSVGDTVFYGSRSGKLLNFAGDDRDKLIVELPNGSRDVFPVQGTTLKKPSLMRKATQWAIGEDSLTAAPEKGIGQHDTRDRLAMNDIPSATGSHVHFKPGQTLYQGSNSGKFVRFADGLRKKMLLVQKDDGDFAMFTSDKVSAEKPKFMARAKSYLKGESVNENFSVGSTVYCGSRSGVVQGFAQDDRTKLLVKLPSGSTDVFPVEKTSKNKPSFARKATQWAIGEDAETELAPEQKIQNPGYKEGQMLYCGSRSGTFVRMAKDLYDHSVKVVVKNAAGDSIFLPVEKVTTKKPGMMAKAKNFVVGEEVNEGFQPGQTVYCNGKSGKVVDYARGDATKSSLIVKMANGQTESHPVGDVSTTPSPRKQVAEDFGSSDMGAAMRSMVKYIKDQCNGDFSPTPELIEQAAMDAGSWFADMLGVDTHEAAEIFTHHFMLRLRSGQMQKLVDEDTVVASAGTAGQVNVQGGVIGEEEEVDEADITLGVPKGEIYKPKMQCLHYFNTKGTQEWELEKLGMKKDKFGRYYLPQYDKSGINYDQNFNTLSSSFGNPRTINLKK